MKLIKVLGFRVSSACIIHFVSGFLFFFALPCFVLFYGLINQMLCWKWCLDITTNLQFGETNDRCVCEGVCVCDFSGRRFEVGVSACGVPFNISYPTLSYLLLACDLRYHFVLHIFLYFGILMINLSGEWNCKLWQTTAVQTNKKKKLNNFSCCCTFVHSIRQVLLFCSL